MSRRPPVIVCERCDTLARHWRTIGDQWLCEACIRAVDDHTRWCACGLMLAGSTRQILAMCEVHWRTCGTWQLLTHDPRAVVTPACVTLVAGGNTEPPAPQPGGES